MKTNSLAARKRDTIKSTRDLPSIEAAADEGDYVYGTRVPSGRRPERLKPPKLHPSMAMYHFYEPGQSEFAG